MKKVLSIRLWRGGLSFYYAADGETLERGTLFFGRYGFSSKGVEELLARWKCREGGGRPEAVQLFVDTPYTVFVPEEAVGVSPLQGLLSAAGVEPIPECEPAVTLSVDGVHAVIQLPRGILEVLKSKLGENAALYSPLHESMTAYRRSGIMEAGFVVYPTQENVYLAEYGTGGNLLLAEVYPCRSAADLVYYLRELAAGRGGVCRDVPVFLYGDRPPRYLPVVKEYFAKTRIL